MKHLLAPLHLHLRSHWIFAAALAVVAGDMGALYVGDPKPSRLLEAGVLFDLVVLLPALHWFCYRRSGKAVLFKVLALACLGIWLADKLIPAEHQFLLPLVSPLRYVGLMILAALEVRLLLAVYRLVFGSVEPEEIERRVKSDPGVPEWAANLIALEALIWRRAWLWVKRLLRR